MGFFSEFSQWLDATLAKYNGYFTLPILSPSMDDLGKRVQARTNRYYADVVATSRLSPSMFVFQSQGSPIASADISGASTNLMATGSFFTQNAMADFNGDGFADIATVSQSTVYVYESVGASSPMPNGDLGYANTVVTVQNQSIALSR